MESPCGPVCDLIRVTNPLWTPGAPVRAPPTPRADGQQPRPPPGHPRRPNRTAPDAPQGAPEFLPEQRLDLGTALAAYTAGSAYVNHLDDIAGSITVGKSADLVVLDRDPFAAPPEEIAATRVLETIVDGQRVHAARDA